MFQSKLSIIYPAFTHISSRFIDRLAIDIANLSMNNIPEQCKKKNCGEKYNRDFPAEKRKRFLYAKRILPGDKPQIKQKRKRKHIKGIQLKRRPEIAVKQRARSAGRTAAGTLNPQDAAGKTDVKTEAFGGINVENSKDEQSAERQKKIAESFHF